MNNWKIAAFAGWSLLAIAIVSGAAGKGEMRLKRLIIEDEKGRSSIQLETIEGQPSVTLLKPESGKPSMRLTVTDEYPRISLYNHSTGRPGLLVSPTAAHFYSPKHLKAQRISLSIDSETDLPYLFLTGLDGKTITQIPPEK